MKELSQLQEQAIRRDLEFIGEMIDAYFRFTTTTEFETEELKKEFIPEFRHDIEKSCQLMLELLELYEEQYDLPELQTED